MKRVSLLAAFVALTQTGCLFVGGYSSEGGFYVWPGSILITAVVVALFLYMRRRR
jgi:hypothetical protein